MAELPTYGRHCNRTRIVTAGVRGLRKPVRCLDRVPPERQGPVGQISRRTSSTSMFAIRNASSRPHSAASSSWEIRRMRPAGTTSVAGGSFWSRPHGIRPVTRISIVLSWVTPAVADIRARFAHGQ